MENKKVKKEKKQKESQPVINKSLREYTEENLNDDISKLKKKMEQIELSIVKNDEILSEKKKSLTDLSLKLSELEQIKSLLGSVNV